MSLRVETERNTNYVTNTDNNGNNKKLRKTVTEHIVEPKKEEENIDKLPQGYSIEKSPNVDNKAVKKDDDDDDKVVKKNTDDNNDDYETTFGENGIEIDSEQRIHTRKSIAQHADNQYTNAIGAQMEEAFFDDIDDGDETGTKYVKAMQDIKDDNFNFFNIIPEKLHVYGSGTAEFSGYKTTDDENNRIKINTQAYKGNVGITYGKSYKNGGSLKVIGFGQATKTTDHIDGTISKDSKTYKIPDEIFDEIDEKELNEIPDIQELNKTPIDNTDINTDGLDDISELEHFNMREDDLDIKAYVGAQYKFKNGDLTTGTLSFSKDGGNGDTRFDGMARYDNKKYGIYGQFNITDYINKADSYEVDQNTHNTVVTNIKFGFNNDESEDYEGEDFQPYEQSTETDTDPQQLVQESVKKWKLHTHPYVISRIVGQSFENGLGVEQSFKGTGSNSKLNFVPAVQYSIDIVPKDEENLDYMHNIAFGGNIDYTKSLAKGTLNATAKIRNKYTFGDGNSFTAALNTAYRNEQVSVGAEAVYIKIPDSNYFGVNADVTYKPKKVKWLETFITGNYVSNNDSDSNISGWSTQLGARVNF